MKTTTSPNPATTTPMRQSRHSQDIDLAAEEARLQAKVASLEAKQRRQRLIEDLEKRLLKMADPKDPLDEIMLQSITHAHLPKQEFIEEMRKFHGYTFENILANHYGFAPHRILLGLMSGFGFFHAAHGLLSGSSKETEEGINGIVFKDLKIYLRLMKAALEGEPRENGKNPEKEAILQDLEHDLDQEKP